MTISTDWTSAAEAKGEVQRLWERGRLLAAHLAGEELFPLRLRFRRPDPRSLAEHFEQVRRWIRGLEEAAKPQCGFGYEILWSEVLHRQLGRNRVPAGLVVPTRQDALRWIRQQARAEQFDMLAAATLDRFPALRGWMMQKPMALVEHAEEWKRVLAVLEWFSQHPRAGIYLRQVDVPGVDTKFIEVNRSLFIELLDLVLPPDALDVTAGRDFEARYGLRAKPRLVRFRILDSDYWIDGLSDIATPVSEFATLALPVRRLFITENEINGLAFPDVPHSAIIFGLGYGLERLAEVPRLGDTPVYYWGDIDTHGFAMLDRLRGYLPHLRSLLMDRETLLAHRQFWAVEDSPNETALTRLTPEEAALYEDLAADRLGDRVRLEQERVGFGAVERAIRELDATES